MASKLIPTEEDKLGLLPLWEAIYSIYEKFAEICDRHGLRYYALGGTLLGAVRHDGFIPWDDDLDVAMPRADYDRFIEYAKSELPANLKFIDWHNTPEFHLLFGKVQETRRECVENLEKALGLTLSNGIFMDIFPLDGYPESVLERGMLKTKHFIMSFVWRYLTCTSEQCRIKGKIAIVIGKIISCFFPCLNRVDKLLVIYDRDARRHSFDNSEQVADVAIFQDIFHLPPQLKTSWGVPHSHAFNGMKIMIPEKPDELLRCRYGADYMTPPPENKRLSTHRCDKHLPWWLGPTRPNINDDFTR